MTSSSLWYSRLPSSHTPGPPGLIFPSQAPSSNTDGGAASEGKSPGSPGSGGRPRPLCLTLKLEAWPLLGAHGHPGGRGQAPGSPQLCRSLGLSRVPPVNHPAPAQASGDGISVLKQVNQEDSPCSLPIIPGSLGQTFLGTQCQSTYFSLCLSFTVGTGWQKSLQNFC